MLESVTRCIRVLETLSETHIAFHWRPPDFHRRSVHFHWGHLNNLIRELQIFMSELPAYPQNENQLFKILSNENSGEKFGLCNKNPRLLMKALNLQWKSCSSMQILSFNENLVSPMNILCLWIKILDLLQWKSCSLMKMLYLQWNSCVSD